ncbi:type IV secretion system protein VirD4 [Maledivibacter halophilus]|uniref:Type IV secretion system protein VirD4 n=1 Tax=Maledivibacter halophilus TaxID=36842 RepID=A0A1T5LQF4_9FIRM|nr:type IV secretion system protein VirD4 [Maledivibacter halophilus]
MLGVVYYYVANHKPYQSDLIQITPNISTPVSAGQKQFGSARWLTDKEQEMYFKSFMLNSEDDQVKKLKELADEEVKSMKNEGVITGDQGEGTDEESEISTYERLLKEETAKAYDKQESAPKSEENQTLKSGGIVLGMKKERGRERIYYIDDDTHTLCIGATRSGKTRSIVLETIGVLGLSGESMVISDPKSELYNYTAPYLNHLGYHVIALDFKNPLKSHRYNFLQPIIDAIDEDNLPGAIEATWDLTASLVPENSHNEKIWSNGEASIIAAAIMSVVYDNRQGNNRRFQNMSNVYFFISEMCKTINGKMPLTSYLETIPSNHPARGLLSISEVAPSKTKGSFFTSALTNLRLFTNPLIYSMTCESDVNPSRISSKKTALFIILPDEKRTYYSLASLFVNQCYMALVKVADNRGGRLEKRVNMVLDEFGNFTQIPDFGNKLTVGGGRGIRFNLFIQSFSQLDEIYKKEVAQTIKGNCETWIYLQADDLNTLEEISKKLGNYTVSTYSLSSSHGKYTTPSTSHSTNLTHRALLTVDEIKLISRPYVLVTSRNHPAIMKVPDLSKWLFNKLYGLGDKEHNRDIRSYREGKRQERKRVNAIGTWNIWEFHKEGNTEAMLKAQLEQSRKSFQYEERK